MVTARYAAGVIGHCVECGFYFYDRMPKTHLTGCSRACRCVAQKPDDERPSQLHESGCPLFHIPTFYAGG